MAVVWDYMSYQTAVDIARTERGDPMIAAQKLRDFSISYEVEGSTMIMVIDVEETPEVGVPKKKPQILDHDVARLEGEVPPRWPHCVSLQQHSEFYTLVGGEPRHAYSPSSA